MVKKTGLIALVILAFCISTWAQEPVDLQMITKIKQEGFSNSQVMETLSYLTDVFGPRLAGSPAYRKAAEWCRDKLTEWGLENARLEPWGTFGKGWELQEFSLEMTSPQYLPLLAFPKAWIRGTDGEISGSPVLVEIQSPEDVEKYKGKLHNAIVMMGGEQDFEMDFSEDARRYDEEELNEMAQAPEIGGRRPFFARREEFRRQMQIRRQLSQLLKEEGVAVVLEPSRGQDGTLFVSSGGSRNMKDEPGIPSAVVAVEHYNRIVRMLKKKVPVTLRVNIRTQFFTEDSLGYNVIAEIPGTDKKLKKELVMLGGHLDSWHAGTGATDNAAGCAVAMEAVRILKALDVKPRRTIRIALWDAEEEGLLGSRYYVTNHFADRSSMEKKPEYDLLSAYYNLDNGSGKIRGIYLQGNDAVRPIFEAWLEPFHDLGATTVTIRNTGGTDHLSFDRVGLPGFQFIQDPLEYSKRTHHTNMDVYEHCMPGDLMQASVIMASFVYHTAMRDQKLPRKPMPKPSQGRRFRF